MYTIIQLSALQTGKQKKMSTMEQQCTRYPD